MDRVVELARLPSDSNFRIYTGLNAKHGLTVTNEELCIARDLNYFRERIGDFVNYTRDVPDRLQLTMAQRFPSKERVLITGVDVKTQSVFIDGGRTVQRCSDKKWRIVPRIRDASIVDEDTTYGCVEMPFNFLPHHWSECMTPGVPAITPLAIGAEEGLVPIVMQDTMPTAMSSTPFAPGFLETAVPIDDAHELDSLPGDNASLLKLLTVEHDPDTIGV